MVAAGIARGLSQASKNSAVLLPVVCVLLLAHGLITRPTPVMGGPAHPTRRVFLARLASALVAMMPVAFLSLGAVYGFKIEQLPGWPWAVPLGGHIKTLLLVREHMAEGHSAFLAGQLGMYGWWWYFPFTFAVKTPLPTLILLGACIIYQISSVRIQSGQDVKELIWRGVMLGAFPVLFFLTTLFSTVNIGYRHLLPVLPFTFVFIGRQVSNVKYQASNAKRHLAILSPCLLVTILLVWYAISAAMVFPFPHGYFNELVGGSANGWKYLADSNTEWGQSLKELKRYMDARGWPSIKLSIFTLADPAAYDLNYEPLPPTSHTPQVMPARFNPPPGRYAISTTALDGLGIVNPDTFDWFRHREPVARVAHTMFVYQVDPPAVTQTWVAQCSIPEAPLDPETLSEGLGRNDLRQATFDCTQSWLYPQGAGWYVLSSDVSSRSDRFITLHLARSHLVYEQKSFELITPFRVHEWMSSEAVGLDRIQVGIAAPSEWPPTQAEAEGSKLSAPLLLEGGLEWLGYRLGTSQGRAGQTVELETRWRVNQLPEQPLSLMAHLLAPDGHPVSVGDGLGVPIEDWRVGDTIVQRHVFEIPPDTPPGTYWVQIGAYTLTDLHRLAIISGAQPAADRIVLTRWEVVD